MKKAIEEIFKLSPNNEISYVHYHSHRLFTWAFEHIQGDKDGLLATSRLLKDMHICLILLDGYVAIHPNKYDHFDWHKHGILEVFSIVKDKEIWKLFHQYGQGNQCEAFTTKRHCNIQEKKKISLQIKMGLRIYK